MHLLVLLSVLAAALLAAKLAGELTAIENLGITISSATFRDVFSFGFLILMLVIRPQGFAAKKGSRV